ncbi:MAG: hypothetical protein RBG13Loki_1779 [Promethearchaeota archaeon CR_4]|nr:MAG: hypothetical protein RBG13Loki_1779 [Candidatus Lokiarchaeota archaeon CR_4]
MNRQGYTTPKYYLWKGLVFLGIFSIVHFIYDWLEYPAVLIIGAADESVFSHMKMAFWSYLFVLVIEYAYFRKDLTNKRGFIFARIISSTIIPWVEILIWYIVPAIAKAEIPLPLELTWSFSILFVAVLLLGGLEREWQQGTYPKYALISVLVLLGLSLFFFTAFTFEKPWIDIFYLPPS